MAKTKFTYKGKTIEELKLMTINEFSQLVPSRQRRKIKRGFTDAEKILLKKVRKNEKNIETHCRSMIVVPEMVGMTIKIHTGKEFLPVIITEEMVGQYLGEFAMTRRKVNHNAPGVGATRSSTGISVK